VAEKDAPGETLRSSRLRLALKQADVAGLLGTSQANVSAYEAGRLEPGELVRSRIAAFGELEADSLFVTYQASTLASAAAQLRTDLRNDVRQTDMLRVVIQASDDFARFENDPDRWFFLAEPSPTGSRNWDAMLAGLAVHLCRVARMDRTPRWTRNPSNTVDLVWWLGSDAPTLHAHALQDAIPSMRSRGVMLSRRVLESV
jgi:transcriptional regulator with XRE-family HTH domain